MYLEKTRNQNFLSPSGAIFRDIYFKFDIFMTMSLIFLSIFVIVKLIEMKTTIKQLFATMAFLLLFQLSINGQNQLTNREIYNFEVGDVIHVELTCNFCEDGAHGIRYLKRHFLSKHMSQDQDTVFFEVLDSLFKLSGRPGWQVKAETHIISYHSLDSVAKLFDQSTDLYMDFDFSDTTTFSFQHSNDYSDIINDVFYKEVSFEVIQGNWHTNERVIVTNFKNFGTYYSFYNDSKYEGKESVQVLLYSKRGDKVFGEPLRDLLAEKQLSNREIYNFEVGDIIHFTENPPSIVTFRHVLSKSYSANNDSVTYQFLDTIITTNAHSSNMEVKVHNLIYSNLDSFPKTYNFDTVSNSGYFFFSHSLAANTNKNTYNYSPNYGVGVVAHYYEGLGRYSTTYTNSGFWNSTTHIYLNYYKKDNTSWGTPLNVKNIESSLFNQISIYPNPSNSEVTLKRQEVFSNSQITIYDINGRLVYQSDWKQGDENHTINTEQWQVGVYYVALQTAEGEKIVRKLMIAR